MTTLDFFAFGISLGISLKIEETGLLTRYNLIWDPMAGALLYIVLTAAFYTLFRGSGYLLLRYNKLATINKRSSLWIFLIMLTIASGGTNPEFLFELGSKLKGAIPAIFMLAIVTLLLAVFRTIDARKWGEENWQLTPLLWNESYEHIVSVVGLVTIASLLFRLYSFSSDIYLHDILWAVPNVLPWNFGGEWSYNMLSNLILSGRTLGELALYLIPLWCIVATVLDLMYAYQYGEKREWDEKLVHIRGE